MNNIHRLSTGLHHEASATYNENSPAFVTGEMSEDAPVIPVYDPANQFTVADLQREYPQWQEEVTSNDPELVAISYARTKALRQLGRSTGQGNQLVHNGGEGLLWALRHTPVEVGSAFEAHGIANKYDPVVALDDLLIKGVDKSKPLYSMSFGDVRGAGGLTGADHPITTGGLILLGKGSTALRENNIAHVVVGEEYMQVLDLMRDRYPNVSFIPWNEAPVRLTQDTNTEGITNIDMSVEYGKPVRYSVSPQYALGAATVGGQVVVPAVEYTNVGDDDEVVW